MSCDLFVCVCQFLQSISVQPENPAVDVEYMVCPPMAKPIITCIQGSAHTGREWLAPTTTSTQPFLPPLKLKVAYFCHHSERIIYYIQCNIITFSLQLSHHSDHSGQNPVYILATFSLTLSRTFLVVIVFASFCSGR